MLNKFTALNNIWIPYRSMLFSKSKVIEEAFYLTDLEKVRSHNIKLLDNETIIKNFSFKNHLTNTQDLILSLIPFNLFKCENLIVFGWSYWQIIVILIYRKFFNKKTVVFFESTIVNHNFFIDLIKKILKKIFLSKHFYYCSPSLNCDRYLKNIYSDVKVFRINNFSLFSPSQEKINNRNRRIDFLYVGRNSKEKNIDLLMDLYMKKKDNYSFMFIGDSFPLVHNDDQSNFTNNIEFYFLNAKFLLLPSYNEPYGMVAIEAHSCGCIPLVSSNSGVASELNKDFIIDRKIDLDKYYKKYTCLHEKLLNTKKKFSLNSTLNELDKFLNSI